MSRRKSSAPAELSLIAAGASWCAPWVLLQPVLDEIEAAGTGVVRIDVDADEASAERWRIVSLPTIILVLRGSEERRRFTGAISAAELLAAVQRRR